MTTKEGIILRKITNEIIKTYTNAQESMDQISRKQPDYGSAPGFDYHAGRNDALDTLFNMVLKFYGDDFDDIYHSAKRKQK